MFLSYADTVLIGVACADLPYCGLVAAPKAQCTNPGARFRCVVRTRASRRIVPPCEFESKACRPLFTTVAVRGVTHPLH